MLSPRPFGAQTVLSPHQGKWRGEDGGVAFCLPAQGFVLLPPHTGTCAQIYDNIYTHECKHRQAWANSMWHTPGKCKDKRFIHKYCIPALIRFQITHIQETFALTKAVCIWSSVRFWFKNNNPWHEKVRVHSHTYNRTMQPLTPPMQALTRDTLFSQHVGSTPFKLSSMVA